MDELKKLIVMLRKVVQNPIVLSNQGQGGVEGNEALVAGTYGYIDAASRFSSVFGGIDFWDLE
jgi:hypothetical protein